MIAMPAQEYAMEVRPDTVIVIPADASTTEQYAATELSKYIFKINGVMLSVADDSAQEAESEILIGNTNREPEGVEPPELKYDGYWLLNQGDKLWVKGENDRGTLYGVYGLLEDVFDCRFYTSTVEKIPKKSVLTVPDDLNSVVNPAFEFRDHNWYSAMGSDYSAKRGYNGHCCGLSDQCGGAMNYYGFVHTLGSYVPRSIYYEEHPEYFSTSTNDYQLCLSNPEVLEIVTNQVLENLKSNPNAKILSLSQNDNYFCCTCEKCTAIDEEEGSHMGTLLRFVNAVADRVAEEYPDVIIDTLAYQYTRTPPLITKPRDNVVIRFCTIEACFSHPLSECQHVSKDFSSRMLGKPSLQSDLEGWSKICDRIYIWDYCTNYAHYLCTFPNLYILDDNFNYFIDNHVTGVFEEANYESIDGEFGELKAYLISKLMWHPDGDPKLYIRDFLKGVYEDGAGPVGEYIDYVCTKAETDNIHVSIYDGPSYALFDPAYMAEQEKAFERAEWLACDPKPARRVRKSGLQVRYINLLRMSVREPAKEALMDAFEEDVRAFGITSFKESRNQEDSLRMLREQ